MKHESKTELESLMMRDATTGAVLPEAHANAMHVLRVLLRDGETPSAAKFVARDGDDLVYEVRFSHPVGTVK